MQKLVWKNSLGDEINLTSGNYGITQWEGFSNASLNIQSQQVPFQDGGVYLDSLINQRELSVTLKMQDNGNLEERYRMRRELIHSLNPKLGEGYLIYTNDFISKRIKCVAQIPLFETHNSNDSGTPKASLAWTACEPYWEDLEETVAEFGENQSVEIMNNGDIPCAVEINIDTMNIITPVIKNLRTNKIIRLSGMINSSIYINTNAGKKEVVGNIGSLLPQLVYANLNSVFYVEQVKKYFAFAYEGIPSNYYAISDDGEKWRFKKIPTFLNFEYSNLLGYFICVGYNTINKSYDGENWEVVAYHNNFSHLYIAWSDKLGKFLGAYGSDVYESEDGIVWQKLSVSFDDARQVQWVEKAGKFFIGRMGARNTFTYDGITFEEINLTSFLNIKYIDELNLYITCGNDKIKTSQNGTNWNSITITDVTIAGLLWNGEKLLASGYAVIEQKNVLYESTNGVNFAYVQDMEYQFNDGIIAGDKCIAVGNKGLIEKCSDGENWEVIKYNPSENDSMNPVAFTYCNVNNKIYALFETGEKPLISTYNGIDWNVEKLDSHLQIIKWIKEKNIFVGYNGSQIVSSTDGITWTNRISVGGCGNFCYSKQLDKIYSLYLYYNSGTDKTELHVLTSSDGISWNNAKKLEIAGSLGILTRGIVEFAYSETKNIFLAFADTYPDNYMFKSIDGVNWSGSVTEYNMRSLFRADRDGYFYFCEEKLYKSEDGSNWTVVDFGNDVYLNCGCFAEELGIYCVTANYVNETYKSTSFYSANGINWIKREYLGNGTNNAVGIIYSPYSNRFITGNTFLISASATTEKTENLISLLTQDSDMFFNLEVGNNKILFSQIAGKANVTIKYRQKYIGV